MFLEQSPQSKNWLEALLQRRLVIHIGKGGVGRSMMTAAMAQLAAAEGKRVLVCEVNAKERMSSLLGGKKPESFSTLDEIWQPQENIWAVNIRPWTGMKEYVTEILRMRLVFNLVFENGAIRYFLKAVPGLQELIFMGKVWFHVTQTLADGSPRFDMVIVDAPATGHGLAMLRISEVILDVAPPGPMRTAAERIQSLLKDSSKTWINLVTLPEEMPINETIELHDKLKEILDLSVGCTWVNQWPSESCTPKDLELMNRLLSKGLAAPEAWPYFAAGQYSHTVYEKAQHHTEELRSHVNSPVFCVPRINAHGGDERTSSDTLVPFLRNALSPKEQNPLVEPNSSDA